MQTQFIFILTQLCLATKCLEPYIADLCSNKPNGFEKSLREVFNKNINKNCKFFQGGWGGVTPQTDPKAMK